MAAVGIGEIRAIVDDVVKLYQKFKAAHEQIVSVGDEMKMLKLYLSDLENFLDTHPKLTFDAPKEINNLRMTLKEIHRASREIFAIFKDWDNNDNLIARAGWAWVGSNPDRLRKLGERIDSLRTYLRDWMSLVQSRLLVKIEGQVRGKSPNPPTPNRAKSVLFLDNYDTGRSVVGQCYAQLLQQWTERVKNTWPIQRLHSAGVRVEGSGNVGIAQKALKMHTESPGVQPLKAALDALFDNKLFHYKYKEIIWNEAKTHVARSIRDDYAKYDYIIVFDDYIKRGFEQLSGHLEEKHQAKPMKGKLVHLADYHPNSQVRNISKGLQEGDVRDRWNKTVAQIKVAFKRFLTQELHWHKLGS